MRYQPTWVKGCETVDRFQRECASRYDVIRKVMAKYKRPFSVFDFGANMGYFTFRIAEDFPHATVFAVDKHKELGILAEANGLPNVVTVSAKWTAKELQAFAECEAVDVVLALNVLHHMGDWPQAFKACRELGQILLMETPGPGDSGATGADRHDGLREAIEPLGCEMARFPAHTTGGAERILYVSTNWGGKVLKRQTLDAKKRCAPLMPDTRVYLDFENAEFSRDGKVRAFVPGFNLWNAVTLQAAWPKDMKDRITAEAGRMERAGVWHDDLRPWNFVLSGDRAEAIDIGNKKWRKEPEPDGLAKCLAML